jgi:aminoglycoside phosphotransferase (APT) family kinase protein
LLNIDLPGALAGYLRQRGIVAADETLTVEPLSGGVSSRTYRVRSPRGAWVAKQALPKLRVAVDWQCDPRRVEREALATRRLAELLGPRAVAPLVLVDPAEHLLLLEAVPEPHTCWKAQLLAGQVDLLLVRQFAELLAAIHHRAWLARASLAEEFAERTYFELLRLEPYYAYTARQVPASEGFFSDLAARTLARRETLVHGDFSPKNVLVQGERLVLLDHEVAHWGDPAFDLGFALAHLLSKAHHLPASRGALAAAAGEFWQAYRAALGQTDWSRDLEPRAVDHAVGCLLARAAGRSPLEYLSPAERAAQQAAGLGLVARRPEGVGQLAGAFLERLGGPGPGG